MDHIPTSNYTRKQFIDIQDDVILYILKKN